MNRTTCAIVCAIFQSILLLADGEPNATLEARLVKAPPSARPGSTVEMIYAIVNISTGPVVICTRDIFASCSWSGSPDTVVVDENGQEMTLGVGGGGGGVMTTCGPPISSNDFLTLPANAVHRESFTFSVPTDASLTAVTYRASFWLPVAHPELGYMNWTGRVVSGETTITIEK